MRSLKIYCLLQNQWRALALVFPAFLLAVSLSGKTLAMDPLNEMELAAVDGKTGVTLATGKEFNVYKISFDKMYWGDPDSHPVDSNYGILVVSGSPGKVTMGLRIDKGGILELDCATTGTSTTAFDQVRIPPNTTFWQITANAPVIGGEGRGMSLYLQTDTKMNLGIGNISNYTSSPYPLGSLSVSNFFFGAVSDPEETANNDTKIYIWGGDE